MGLNGKKPSVEIPAPSDSEAEDSSSSSSEEEQQEQMTRTTPTLKPQQQHEEEDVDDQDDDEEEEEEEEESDEPEKAAVATVTPSSQKPQSESEEEEEDDKESDDGKAIKLSSVSAHFAVKVNKSPVLTKRAAENAVGSSKNNKKAKVVSDGDGKIDVDVSKKKSVFNRVWSENDEILFLEGFHDYITKNGSDSITNLSSFYDTLKDLDLSLNVTRPRFYDKLRGLKNKYLKNVRREQRVFSKPHEEKIYKVSEKIWGGKVGVIEESLKKNKKAGKRSVEKKDICKMEEPGSSFPRLAASLEFEASTYLLSIDSKEFAKNMVLKFNKKKAKELEDEWNEYSLMEYELYAKRVKIISEQVDAALNVLKHSNLN